MSTTKRTLGDYTIETINGNINIVGNLIVSGNTTTINSTNSSIDDNVITLNKGETGSGVTLGFAGIEVDRGSAAKVAIRWNEGYRAWELLGPTGATLGNIATSVGAGGGLSSVSADFNPALGGNLDISGATIYDSTFQVALRAGTIGSGGTGLYAGSTTGAQLELATTSKAITYGIIFS
jgi:hypothetical protein